MPVALSVTRSLRLRVGVVGSGLAQPLRLAGKVNLFYGSERPHPPATGLLASQDSESTRRIGLGLSCSIHLTDSESQARHLIFTLLSHNEIHSRVYNTLGVPAFSSTGVRGYVSVEHWNPTRRVFPLHYYRARQQHPVHFNRWNAIPIWFPDAFPTGGPSTSFCERWPNRCRSQRSMLSGAIFLPLWRSAGSA